MESFRNKSAKGASIGDNAACDGRDGEGVFGRFGRCEVAEIDSTELSEDSTYLGSDCFPSASHSQINSQFHNDSS